MLLYISPFSMILIPIVILLLVYIYILARYTIKWRRLEKSLLIILFIGFLTYYLLILYNFIGLDYGLEIVFRYLYNESQLHERMYAFLYSIPYLHYIMILITIYLYIRFHWGGFIGRGFFRRIGIYTSIVILGSILLIYLNGYLRSNPGGFDQGMGGYPLQDDILILITYILTIFAASFSSISAIIFLSLWTHRMIELFRLGRDLIITSSIVTVLSIIFRLYIGLFYQSRSIPYNLVSIDLILVGLLAINLFILDSLSLAWNRVLGCLPFSSYLSLQYISIMLIHLDPIFILGYSNAVHIVNLSLSIIVPLIFYSPLMGRSIFRRSFYPWMSEDYNYFLRASSSSIYFIIVAALIYMTINLSIYHTAGRIVRPSQDFIQAILSLLFLSSLIYSIVNLMVRRYRNFYLIYLIIFILIFLFIGGRTYNLFDPFPLHVLALGIGLLLASISFIRGYGRRLTAYILVSLLMYSTMYFSSNIRGVRTQEDLTIGEAISLNGLNISLVDAFKRNSTIEVVSGDVLLPLEVVIVSEMEVDRGIIILEKSSYPTHNLDISRGYIVLHPLNSSKLMIDRFEGGKDPKVYISLYKYGGIGYIQLAILPILYIISLVFYIRRE